MPSCVAIAAPVTTSSPVTIRTRMLAFWAFRTASFDSARGGSIIPTMRRHLQARDQGQQVAVGIEVRRVDVPGGRDHDPQTLAAEALHLLGGSAVLLVAPGDVLAVGQGGRGPPDHGRAGSLDEGPDDGVPGLVLGVREDGHELVGGVERQGREPGVGGLRAFDVELRLVPEDEQRALGGIADDLAVDELGVVGDQERQDRLPRSCWCCRRRA